MQLELGLETVAKILFKVPVKMAQKVHAVFTFSHDHIKISTELQNNHHRELLKNFAELKCYN